MKIIQIIPGSGDNFYCENCLRDMEMVHALRRLGHDVMVVPLYLPGRLTETQPMNDGELFYGMQDLTVTKGRPVQVISIMPATV